MTPFAARAILEHQRGLALWLFGIAGLTDFLDGWLARRFEWRSRMGALLDPAADKALMAAAYICLGVTGELPWWLVAIVFGRDVLLVFGAAAARLWAGLRQFPPSIWGKWSTAIQMAAALAALLGYAGPLIWLAAAGTVVSGVHYVWRGAGEISRARKMRTAAL